MRISHFFFFFFNLYIKGTKNTHISLQSYGRRIFMSYSKRIYDNAIKGIPELAFNNTYDVDFVTNQTLDVRDQLFTRCLEVQKRNCGINIIT